jgi:hypothetical protein
MKIQYIVSSNVNYYEKTLPIIIGSLKNANVENILIYIGGSETDFETTYDGIYCKFVTHNSFDYTGIIEFVNNPNDCDYVFLLHDTCEVDTDFKNKVENFDINKDIVYVTNLHVGQCNFAMIRYNLVINNKHYFNTLKNCNKEMAIQHEGHLIRMTLNKTCYPNEDTIFSYETPYFGNTRQVEYFKHIGLKKYKANWGQTQDNKNWIIGV